MNQFNKIIQGDCVEVMKSMQENSVDSIVTDPPYGLEFMGKEWDKIKDQNWHKEWATQAIRILKPGGFILAFGGTRTYHRLACAIEDAGFEIRDMIEWVYGSGFPKSLNIGKAVDKLQGNEREWISENPNKASDEVERASAGKCQSGRTTHPDITKGTSEWEGWGTALKPAHEPICMARKPLSEKTVALNVLKWGTGGINIDESRVGTNDVIEFKGKRGFAVSAGEKLNDNGTHFAEEEFKQHTQGRFPANLIHDGSDEVRECFPESKGCSGGGIRKNKSEIMPSIQIKGDMDNSHLHRGDSGNASRFFKSIIYQAKASKSERNMGCDSIEPKQMDDSRKEGNPGGDNTRNRGVHRVKNNHPTVKPIALMEYLIKMVTREDSIILDPFMGSGTTGIACKNLNRNFIGIELNHEYFKIAEKRIGEIQRNVLEKWIGGLNNMKAIKEKL